MPPISNVSKTFLFGVGVHTSFVIHLDLIILPNKILYPMFYLLSNSLLILYFFFLWNKLLPQVNFQDDIPNVSTQFLLKWFFTVVSINTCCFHFKTLAEQESWDDSVGSMERWSGFLDNTMNNNRQIQDGIYFSRYYFPLSCVMEQCP